jgi:CDP-glucose 4,6-dehydratase
MVVHVNSLLANSFKGKRVMVTGHTGFKGSWLTIWLLRLGAEVIGYALDPLNIKDNFNQSNIGEKIIDIRGDIRDLEKLNEVFQKYKPEIVFHLAAQPLVRQSYLEPRLTYEVNVMGTLNVLEAIRNCERTRVGIIITSDKCYENKEWIWGYRENDPMGGYDPYSSSKGCVELLTSSYRQSFFDTENYLKHGKIIATVRAGNVIGGGDWSMERIIPDCIRALENQRDIIVRNPNSIRPWQHVLEPLSGYLLLCLRIIEKGTLYSGAWNFGPEPESIVNVGEIVNLLIKHWGEGNWTHPVEDTQNLHEAKLLNLDTSKARHVLGWRPTWKVDRAIEETAKWYKNYRFQDAYDICTSQIEEYLKEGLYERLN